MNAFSLLFLKTFFGKDADFLSLLLAMKVFLETFGLKFFFGHETNGLKMSFYFIPSDGFWISHSR